MVEARQEGQLKATKLLKSSSLKDYHDLYDELMGPMNVAAFNKMVFTALKPGGVYVVLDHAAVKGSGIDATDTLHRIDPARVLRFKKPK